jgi:CheY-like chemotaxis protein
MPRMDGIEVAKAIFALNPTAKIIASSGLYFRSQLPDSIATQLTNFLPKPYTAKAMLQAFREAIPPRDSSLS